MLRFTAQILEFGEVEKLCIIKLIALEEINALMHD